MTHLKLNKFKQDYFIAIFDLLQYFLTPPWYCTIWYIFLTSAFLSKHTSIQFQGGWADRTISRDSSMYLWYIFLTSASLNKHPSQYGHTRCKRNHCSLCFEASRTFIAGAACLPQNASNSCMQFIMASFGTISICTFLEIHAHGVLQGIACSTFEYVGIDCIQRTIGAIRSWFRGKTASQHARFWVARLCAFQGPCKDHLLDLVHVQFSCCCMSKKREGGKKDKNGLIECFHYCVVDVLTNVFVCLCLLVFFMNRKMWPKYTAAITPPYHL